MRAGTHTHTHTTNTEHVLYLLPGFTSGLENPCQIKTVKLREPTPEIRLTQTTSEQGEGFCQVTQS